MTSDIVTWYREWLQSSTYDTIRAEISTFTDTHLVPVFEKFPGSFYDEPEIPLALAKHFEHIAPWVLPWSTYYLVDNSPRKWHVPTITGI